MESVKPSGVNQPALVRPREGGGYEIAGHRRQRASELAGFANVPCNRSYQRNHLQIRRNPCGLKDQKCSAGSGPRGGYIRIYSIMSIPKSAVNRRFGLLHWDKCSPLEASKEDHFNMRETKSDIGGCYQILNHMIFHPYKQVFSIGVYFQLESHAKPNKRLTNRLRCYILYSEHVFFCKQNPWHFMNTKGSTSSRNNTNFGTLKTTRHFETREANTVHDYCTYTLSIFLCCLKVLITAFFPNLFPPFSLILISARRFSKNESSVGLKYLNL